MSLASWVGRAATTWQRGEGNPTTPLTKGDCGLHQFNSSNVPVPRPSQQSPTKGWHPHKFDLRRLGRRQGSQIAEAHFDVDGRMLEDHVAGPEHQVELGPGLNKRTYFQSAGPARGVDHWLSPLLHSSSTLDKDTYGQVPEASSTSVHPTQTLPDYVRPRS